MQLPETIQDLPPKWAHFCLDIENFLFQELQINLQGKKLLIALSGGVDSSALLIFAHTFRKRWNSDIIAAHLNHKLRTDSDREEAANQRLCETLNIFCYVGRSQVRSYCQKMHLGLEEGARKIRYSFLSALAKKYACDYLLTAHHLNDLAEDFLLRQIRGAAWPSLAGMKAYEAESKILRPFLIFPKKDLQGLVQSLNISWQEDKSNRDLTFMRNRVREQILPLFCRENTNFLTQVKQLWRQANLDRDYWQSELEERRKREEKGPNFYFISCKELRDCHPALAALVQGYTLPHWTGTSPGRKHQATRSCLAKR